MLLLLQTAKPIHLQYIRLQLDLGKFLLDLEMGFASQGMLGWC